MVESHICCRYGEIILKRDWRQSSPSENKKEKIREESKNVIMSCLH